jgi:hypothetical protein
VAQYAEGRRIVSYFPLGEVQDGDKKKSQWLWTTIADGVHPYDFDSFRVFTWSLRRHRYETAHIERNIHGYAPVLLKKVELSMGNGRAATTGQYPGFSICLENKEGQRVRRDYAFLMNVVRFASDGACETAARLETQVAQSPLPVAPEQQTTESLGQRFRKRLKALTRGWFRG